jgi:hypothetical protein
MLVTYGGTSVLVTKDKLEGDDVYLHRIWSIAKIIESKKCCDLAHVIQMSRFNSYKHVTGVTYSDKIEKQLKDIFG